MDRKCGKCRYFDSLHGWCKVKAIVVSAGKHCDCRCFAETGECRLTEDRGLD